LLGSVATLLAIHGLNTMRWGSRPTDLSPSDVVFRIDLNRASRAELLQVPGFGPSLVDRIESHRRDHGPFHSVDELVDVQGVGPTTLQRVRPWVTVATADDLSTGTIPNAPHSSEKPARAVSKKETAGSTLLDPNRATLDQLQRLPGIGPKMAQRIIDEREKKPFKTVEDLRHVSGIGPKTLDKLRPFLQFGEAEAMPEPAHP
jgi:competence protein ComEA